MVLARREWKCYTRTTASVISGIYIYIYIPEGLKTQPQVFRGGSVDGCCVLETLMGIEQRTATGTNPRIPCVVSKSDRDHGTATTATEPLG